jgi:hypothetical protein
MSTGTKSEYNTQGNAEVTDMKNIYMKLKVLYIGLIRTNNLHCRPLNKNCELISGNVENKRDWTNLCTRAH